MIASFRSRALERFWTKNESRRIDSRHLKKVRAILTALDRATKPDDMNLPSFGLHRLTGDQAGRFAVKVDKNWRITFGWSEQEPDAIEVDYEDYH